jgi:hypothetical protein
MGGSDVVQRSMRLLPFKEALLMHTLLLLRVLAEHRHNLGAA